MIDAEDANIVGENPLMDEPAQEVADQQAPAVSGLSPLPEGVRSQIISQTGSYNYWALQVEGYAEPQLPLKFQEGNPDFVGVNGWTNEQVLQALRSRLSQQNERLPSPDNADALDLLRMAAAALDRRNAAQQSSPLAGMTITNSPGGVQ